MKHRKSVELREVLAVIDKHIERRKSLAKHIKSDRENLKLHGVFEKKTEQVRLERFLLGWVRGELSSLRYIREGKPVDPLWSAK